MTVNAGPLGEATIEVVTLGEAMIAIRSHGQLSMSDRMSASLAGAETNVAIGLARLGHTTSWIGTLGADPAGDLVLRTLRAEGVATAGVRRDTERPTGIMLVDMPTALPPVVTYHRLGSAGSRVAVADVVEAPQRAHLWHLTGVTPALSEEARGAVGVAIATAREQHALVSFDVNYRAKLWNRATATEVLAPLARQADVVVASEDELGLVANGETEAEQISDLLSGIPSEVIVKRGSRGAEHFSAEGTISCKAFPAVEVNSIGAGDAFTAGYLSGLLDGITIEERLWRGALCGALAVTGTGDWEQAPSRAQLASLSSSSAEAIR